MKKIKSRGGRSMARKPKPSSYISFGSRPKMLSPRERKAMAALNRYEAEIIADVHESHETEEIRRAREFHDDERRELGDE